MTLFGIPGTRWAFVTLFALGWGDVAFNRLHPWLIAWSVSR